MPQLIRFPRFIPAAAVLASIALHSAAAQQPSGDPAHFRFAISFPAARSAQPLDGRIILVISNNDKREPRFENNVYEADTQLGFGVDVDALAPGQEAYVDGTTFGYPLITEFARSLFHVTLKVESIDDLLLELLKTHIDGITLVIREKIRGSAGEVGASLYTGLQKAQQKFASAKAPAD